MSPALSPYLILLHSSCFIIPEYFSHLLWPNSIRGVSELVIKSQTEPDKMAHFLLTPQHCMPFGSPEDFDVDSEKQKMTSYAAGG